MDYLRSCYTREVTYVNGDPTKTTRISWYFVEDNCPGFPGWHAFGSLNWRSNTAPPGVGEIPGSPRVYRKGARVGNPTTCRPVPPFDWFLVGQPIGTPGLLRDADGTPFVCKRENVGIGGGIGGGYFTYFTSALLPFVGGGIGNGFAEYELTRVYTSMGGALADGGFSHHATAIFSALGGGLGNGSASYHATAIFSARGGGLGNGSATEGTVSFPTVADLWGDELVSISGGWTIDAAFAPQAYNLLNYNPAPALGDEVQGKFFIKGGSYTLFMLTISASDRGIVTISIDGVAQPATVDGYAGVNVPNQVFSIPITVIGDGMHTLNARVTGKNALSTGYRQSWVKFWIQ